MSPKQLCRLLTIENEWKAKCESRFGAENTALKANDFPHSSYSYIFDSLVTGETEKVWRAKCELEFGVDKTETFHINLPQKNYRQLYEVIKLDEDYERLREKLQVAREVAAGSAIIASSAILTMPLVATASPIMLVAVPSIAVGSVAGYLVRIKISTLRYESLINT